MFGQVSDWGDGKFRWTIHNFFSAILKKDVLESPVFTFADEDFYIEGSFKKKDWVHLYFHSCYEDSDVSQLYVKLGMKTGYRGRQETRSGEVDSEGDFGAESWMPLSELVNRRCEILSDGCLIVFCELKRMNIEEKECVSGLLIPPVNKENVPEEKVSESDSSADEEEMVQTSESEKKILKDLKSLLLSTEDSDVTIKVQGKEFFAHRNILRVRSPVFKSMFSHDTAEKETGVVVIDDLDPAIFPDFLNYVYTGCTKHICDKNVFSLYAAADKYLMKELKEDCVLYMKNNLSADIFCDVMTTASLYDERELIIIGTDFYCNNALEIVKIPNWKIFLHENTTVGNELFIKALYNE